MTLLLRELLSLDLMPEFPELRDADLPLVFHYKQALRIIQRLFLESRFQGKLIFQFQEKKNSNGERLYGALESGLWWQDKQSQVKDGTVVPVILYSDETTATSFRGKKFYPLYLTIGNIPGSMRRSAEAYELVGYIPALVGTEQEMETWRKTGLKSRIFHRCLKEVLDCIIEPGERGVNLADSEGKVRTAYPLFCYYIADWPEGKRVSLTRDGVLTRLPCHSCGVGNDELHLLSDEMRNKSIRDLLEMKQVVETARALLSTYGFKGKGEELAKENSIHVYDNSFWLLPGTNIYVQIAPDLLHQFFLGQVKAYLIALNSYLTSLPNGKQLIQELDESFKGLPSWKGIHRFNSGISDLSFLTAAEYQSILFLLPHAVDSLRLDRQFALLALCLREWYLEVTDEEFTLEKLLAIQGLEDKIGILVKKCKFTEWFSTPKNHFTLHYTPFTMLFEVPDLSSAQAGEAAHKTKVKQAYAKSNKKDPEEFMLKNQTVMVTHKEIVFCQPKPRPPMTAASYISGENPEARMICNLKDKELAPLEDMLLSYLHPPNSKGKVVVSSSQREDIRRSTITRFPSLFINCAGIKQRAVACHSFYGKPRFDDMEIFGTNGELWYGRAIMFFQLKGKDLIFLRWFKQTTHRQGFPLRTFFLTQNTQVISVDSVVQLAAMSPDSAKDKFTLNDAVMEKWKRRERRRLSSQAETLPAPAEKVWKGSFIDL